MSTERTARSAEGSPRVLGVDGGVSRDHIVIVDRGARFHTPGGPGLYASLAAASVLGGGRVRLLQPVPDGERDIIELLTSAHVTFADEPGVLPRLWILDSPQGRRVLSTAAPRGGHELQDDPDLVTQARAAEADNPRLGEVGDLGVLLRCAPTSPNPAGLPIDTLVVIDPDQRRLAADGMTYLRALCRGREAVVCPSRVQLGLIDPDPDRAAEQLRVELDAHVVARLDREGSLVLPRAGGCWRVWADAPLVVDTTGAGDSHAGALAAGLLLHSPAERDADLLVSAVRRATAVVNTTLADWGPWGLPSSGGASVETTHLTTTINVEEIA